MTKHRHPVPVVISLVISFVAFRAGGILLGPREAPILQQVELSVNWFNNRRKILFHRLEGELRRRTLLVLCELYLDTGHRIGLGSVRVPLTVSAPCGARKDRFRRLVGPAPQPSVRCAHLGLNAQVRH